MGKSTKLIVAAIGLVGLGYFLYKKGLFSKAESGLTIDSINKDINDNLDESSKKDTTPKNTLKNPPVCESGYKLQMVDINCNGSDCEVHCVPIPPAPEYKTEPAPIVVVKEPVFKAVPDNPTIFQPYTDIPVEIIVNPYVGVPENTNIPVTDNSFKDAVIVSEPDPFDYINTNYGKEAVNKELNQMLYR